MQSILEGLTRQIGGDTISQISNRVGADEQAVTNAIAMALPMIVGGLANNASDPAGAQSLNSALEQDHDGSLLDMIPVLLGGGAPAQAANPRALDGMGILEHILGTRRAPVSDSIGRQTGLDGGQVMQILMMLAPIVMAYLGRRKREEGLGADGLGETLQQERQRMEQPESGFGGMLGQLFDQNGDGSVADDIARMAPGVLGGLFGRR